MRSASLLRHRGTAWLSLALVGAVLAGCTAVQPIESNPSAPPLSASTRATLATVTPDVPQQPSQATVVVHDTALVEPQNGELTIGPQTFFVGPAVITINDYVHNRLVDYTAGKRTRSVRAPGGDCCSDLRVESGRYWLLADDVVRSYTVTGNALRQRSSRHLTVNEHTQWAGGALIREGDNLVATPMMGVPELIEGPGPVPEQPEIAVSGKTVELHDGQLSVAFETPGAADAVTLLARSPSLSWYWVYVNNPVNWGYVYTFDQRGTVVATYTLPKPGSVVPSRPLQVADDGRLYQMNISDEGVDVLRIAANP